MSSANASNITMASGDSVNLAQIANSSIIRPIAIDPDWTKIQLGFWYAFSSGSYANISGTPRLYLGLCSGGTNVIGDATTDHFVGLYNTDDVWSFTSASIYTSMYYQATTTQFIKKVGTTVTEQGSDVVATWYHYSQEGNPTSNKAMPVYLQITRGSPNFTLQLYYCTNPANVAFAKTDETVFLRELQSNVPTFNASSEGQLSPSAALALAVDESADGTLDHICVAWDREEPVGDMLLFGLGATILA